MCAQRRTKLDAEVGDERIERRDGVRTSNTLACRATRGQDGRNSIMHSQGDRQRNNSEFMDIPILEERPTRVADAAVTGLGYC